jgi:hypothetical protein
MPLNIVEPSLEKVKPELHALYVKDAKSGKYHLELSDLKTYVEARVSPVENELKIAHGNERKLSLSAALRKANIDPHYEELVLANIGDRVALGTEDDKRVVRITAADGGMPMVGSGANGLATLDDLMSETAKRFPSMFKSTTSVRKGETPDPKNTGNKILTRSEFDKLQPVERSQKMREGYKVVDDQADARSANRPPPKPGEKVITREAFDQLSLSARSNKILKEGYKVVE